MDRFSSSPRLQKKYEEMENNEYRMTLKLPVLYTLRRKKIAPDNLWQMHYEQLKKYLQRLPKEDGGQPITGGAKRARLEGKLELGLRK